jgi:histidinol dehydrogenase
MVSVRRLSHRSSDFEDVFRRFVAVNNEQDPSVAEQVRQIIAAVRESGDAAVLDLTRRFDDPDAVSVAALEVPQDEWSRAQDACDPLVLDALRQSHEQVRRYHEQQKSCIADDWEMTDPHGNRLGQRVRGMERVGIYAPGGKASYPSTVIMTAVPARVAGVGEIVLTVPAPGGNISPLILVAAELAGVNRVFKVGGAQAIAALAYGTETIPKVDKIVGPGNIFVATAKGQVFGQVGIDMIAGPSEVVVIADGAANVDWLVMDLFAQAEHDELARAILISPEKSLLDAVSSRIDSTLAGMRRTAIIEASMGGSGALIEARDLAHAAELSNLIAPEHLEIATVDPESLLDSITHAGAIFLGENCAEVIGDYSAGPSHVLPTAGTARFASPLGVPDFQVRSSVLRCSPAGSVALSRTAAILAREEGLEAHAAAADFRCKG